MNTSDRLAPRSTRNIRAARLDAAAGIAAILRELGWGLDANAESVAETERRMVTQLRRCLADDSHSVYVAEVDGTVAGYLAVHRLPSLLSGNVCDISELFAAGSARGGGTGTALLEAVRAGARARGCDRLEFFNRRTTESYTRSSYAKRGWKECPDVAFFTLTGRALAG